MYDHLSRVSIEDWGTGAVLVCHTATETKRFWLPSMRQAVKTKAELEADPKGDFSQFFTAPSPRAVRNTASDTRSDCAPCECR